jgi:hypothetical protein
LIEEFAIAFPVRERVRDGFVASLARTRVPLELPAAAGANATWIAWLVPGAMETAPVDPERLKPGPETVAWEIVTAAAPEFVSVNVCELFEPIATFPKSTLVVFGASTPAVVEFEPGLLGLPALVKPTQPEIDRTATKSARMMADNASELWCLGSPAAPC